MFHSKFYSDDFIREEYPNGWIYLTCKKAPLQFQYRYNHGNDCMVEFAIFQEKQQVGRGAQHTNDLNKWLDHFIFNCHFNTWLSQRKVKAT